MKKMGVNRGRLRQGQRVGKYMDENSLEGEPKGELNVASAGKWSSSIREERQI